MRQPRSAAPRRRPAARALTVVALAGAALPLWTAAAMAQGTLMQAPPPPAVQQQPTTTTTGPNAAATTKLIDPAVQFNASERWLIPSYFRNIRGRQRRAARYKNYPRDLPAGLSNPPSVGDVLPPTVLAEMEPLPKPLIRELPKPRPDTRRYIAGKDVLLVRPSSGKVLDILTNVLH